jgi:hypothetical protein
MDSISPSEDCLISDCRDSGLQSASVCIFVHHSVLILVFAYLIASSRISIKG